MSGNGIGVVPSLPKCPVPVLIYRSYRSVRYRYWCCTELIEVPGTAMKVYTGTGGTGIHIVPCLPKCPVTVSVSYRAYRSARYRYWCHTELTEVSGTGIDVPNLPKCSGPVIPAVCLGTYRTKHTLGVFITHTAYSVAGRVVWSSSTAITTFTVSKSIEDALRSNATSWYMI